VKAAAIAGLALLAGSAQASCPAGLHPVTTAELFFGLDTPAGTISDTDWKAFVDQDVTPRFPAGLTVWDGAGQWREPDGALTREPAKVMLIVLGARRGEDARLAQVIAAYKVRFGQQSVLLTEHRDCARF
jgi:hypothetical protein